MGDVAMTIPVLRVFVNQNPNVKITVLSRLIFKPLFNDIPNVSFYAADVEGIHKGILGLKKLSNELLELNINAVADIHNVLRSKILRFFFSFSIKNIAVINKGRSEKKALTRTHNKIFKQLHSTHERYADVFRKLGFKIDLSNHQFPQKKDFSKTIEELIKNNDKTLIGIAPFAQYKSKMYPLDLIKEVIRELSRNSNYKIIFFGGGKKETDILNSFEKNFKGTLSLAGKLKLKEEIIVISHLDCMLSMDSANAHLAAMQGVKTLTLWGVTHPFTGFYPFDQPIEYAIISDLKKFPNIPCSIYGNKVCKGYEDVMRSIPSKKIIELIEKVVKKIPEKNNFRDMSN